MNSRLNRHRTVWIAVVIAEMLLILYYAAPILLRTPSPFLMIKSDSMLPVIRPGDILVIQGINPQENLEGKVIAYYSPSQGRIIVHRVINDKGYTLIMKGDNNDEEDFFEPERRFVLGKVRAVLR